jgi:hypothetical protein
MPPGRLDLREYQQGQPEPKQWFERAHREQTSDGEIERRQRDADHRNRRRVESAAQA